jgi:CRP-like cAMP-binding protein
LSVARVTRDQKIERLRAVSLFSKCTMKELETLARATTPVHVSAGHVLAREGQRGGEFAVIVDGIATVTRDGHLLGRLDAGSFFGEMALLDGGERVATVTADTPMTLLVMSPNEFDALISGEIPSVARKMLTVLGQRLRDADERLAARGAGRGSPPMPVGV